MRHSVNDSLLYQFTTQYHDVVFLNLLANTVNVNTHLFAVSCSQNEFLVNFMLEVSDAQGSHFTQLLV